MVRHHAAFPTELRGTWTHPVRPRFGCDLRTSGVRFDGFGCSAPDAAGRNTQDIPFFQGLAISLMAGEVASLLLSRMTVPVLYFASHRRGLREVIDAIPSSNLAPGGRPS
jgi:hypothetical protein